MKQYDNENSVKYIQDRWLNRDFEYIALKYKGMWVLYKKQGYLEQHTRGAESHSEGSIDAYDMKYYSGD